MRTYTPEELDSILAQHKQWAQDGGGKWANLTGAYLREANLTRADLREANLRAANLCGADLTGANLYGADLRGADLFTAYLREANLRAADLRGADLTGANLYGADLFEANLTRADLTGANLYGAKMNWRSHDLIAELLRRAAGDDPEKRKVAGLIILSRDWCWEDFQEKCGKDPLFAWAIETLRQYVRDGDDAPAILKEEAGL